MHKQSLLKNQNPSPWSLFHRESEELPWPSMIVILLEISLECGRPPDLWKDGSTRPRSQW